MVLDDLTREKPGVRAWEAEHDEGLKVVAARAGELFEALLEDSAYREALARLANAERPGLDDAELTESASRYAELVVNAASELSRDDARQGAWNKHRAALLPHRERFGKALDEAIREQSDRDESVRTQVEKLRWELVDTYDLPAHRVGVT